MKDECVVIKNGKSDHADVSIHASKVGETSNRGPGSVDSDDVKDAMEAFQW
jgi:hypothetical protein